MSQIADKVSKVKSCLNCVAYDASRYTCELNHKIEKLYVGEIGVSMKFYTSIPLEPCSKPKSNKAFREEYIKRRVLA